MDEGLILIETYHVIVGLSVVCGAIVMIHRAFGVVRKPVTALEQGYSNHQERISVLEREINSIADRNSREATDNRQYENRIATLEREVRTNNERHADERESRKRMYDKLDKMQDSINDIQVNVARLKSHGCEPLKE